MKIKPKGGSKKIKVCRSTESWRDVADAPFISPSRDIQLDHLPTQVLSILVPCRIDIACLAIAFAGSFSLVHACCPGSRSRSQKGIARCGVPSWTGLTWQGELGDRHPPRLVIGSRTFDAVRRVVSFRAGLRLPSLRERLRDLAPYST